MTSQFKRTLFEMVADRDLNGLEAMRDMASDWREKAHARNAIAYVRRVTVDALGTELTVERFSPIG